VTKIQWREKRWIGFFAGVFLGGLARIQEMTNGMQNGGTLRFRGAIDRPLSVWKNHDSKGLQRHRTGSMLRIQSLIIQPRR
jgi:hypothetical protein